MNVALDASRHPTPDEFAHAVTKCAVAHLAIGVGNSDPQPPPGQAGPGFTTADTRAVELLSDVIGRYIETLGLSAGENANAAGRTSTNAYDVLNAMSSLSPRPLSVKDLHTFARDRGLEAPFDRDVSTFPKRRDRRGKAYGSGVSPAQFHSAKRPQHVPSFLPPPPELDKRIKATSSQSSTSKSKKRIRQEAESQAALTQLHGSSATAGIVENASSQPSKKKTSNLRYQKVSGSSVGVSSSSSSSSSSSGDNKAQQILDGKYHD